VTSGCEKPRDSQVQGDVEEDEQEAGGARGHPRLDTWAGRTKVFEDAMRHFCLKCRPKMLTSPNFAKRSKKTLSNVRSS